MGIEPTALAWEARVLPLYDARSTDRAKLLQRQPCRQLPENTFLSVPVRLR